MASFIVYDLIFLILFGIFAVYIFKKNRSSFKRQGWMFLYHTKVGIRLMQWGATKFEKILKPLSYVVIASGYVLMIGILWLITRTVWTYVTLPIPDQLKNLPPIAPLIPYFPALFNLESIFPPLYFTYFLVAIAVITISHEFAHGLFAKLWKIRVKTTGLAFFGPFFGAFVEPDEKKMNVAPKKHQLSILAAGTFANIVMFVLFGLILWAFFSLSFEPNGVIIGGYSQSIINISDIVKVGDYPVTSAFSIPSLATAGLNKITTSDGKTYYASNNTLTPQVIENYPRLIVFDDAPAINNNVTGAITSVNGQDVNTREDLSTILSSLKPNQTVELTTIDKQKQTHNYQIKLDERNGNAFVGIGFYNIQGQGFRGFMAKTIAKIKDPNVYYTATWDGDFAQFIYDMLWWIVMINILVALMNMLPVSILDGGRFFYVTLLGITKSQKVTMKIYKFVGWFILALLALMMGKWFVNLV
ncbi:MAG: site-2 protease family protein [Nanoarchaeota archaeon]